MGLFLWTGAALAAEVCATWGDAGAAVEVEDIPALESSGVAASRGDPGVYYTHDDEEGAALLYAFTMDGEYLGESEVRGATNTDWEDIAAGPCPATVEGEHCLWIGDIGDNDEVRDGITVYVVPDTDAASWDAVACNLRYPEGKRWDAEALLVDAEGAIRVVTKEGDGEAHVFVREDPACDGSTQDLVEEAELSLGAPVTGGAVSQDGGTVVLRGETGKVWTWAACGLWSAAPRELELQLGAVQPEAIGFDADGALITTSEGAPFKVWRIPCEATEEAVCNTCGCATAGFPGALAAALAMLGIARRRR